MAKNEAAPDEDERLLNLFRNRAELKQEFAKLRREGDNLKDQLQKQEGRHLRLQQRLDQLEGMLADPIQAANVTVFYQLRGIWVDSGKSLARLARELVENQIKREQLRSNESFEGRRDASLAELQEQVARAESKLEQTEAEMHAAVAELEKPMMFFRFAKRRRLRTAVDALAAKLDVAQAHYARHKKKCDRLASEQAPRIDDLSTEGKRKINLALIAIAQEYFLHYRTSNVAELAREASVRQVVDVNYGDLRRCRELNDYIDGRIQNVPSGEELLAKVKRRAKYLNTHASYRQTNDAIPVAGSFAIIPGEISADGQPVGDQSIATNILAEEYWEVYSVLLA